MSGFPTLRIVLPVGDTGSRVIVYYDTSALVKLYVAEDGSREMKALLGGRRSQQRPASVGWKPPQ